MQADFRQCLISEEYEQINKDFNEEELYINPKYDHILEKIKNNDEELEAFAEKLKVFVNLDWATSDVSFLFTLNKKLLF